MPAQLIHTIAAVVLKIAYLATGIILSLLGKSLIEKGVTATFSGEGALASTKIKILTSSPGLVFAISGLIVIGTGIVTPAVYRELPPGTELEKLAENLVESRLARSPPGGRLALDLFEHAVHTAQQNHPRQALTYLVEAVVLQPQLLRRALKTPELQSAVRDPIFETIVRERFKLPLTVAQLASPVTPRPLLGYLRVYTATRLAHGEEFEEVAPETAAFPATAGVELASATLARLESLLVRNPLVLIELLEDAQFRWILENEVLVGGLRAKVDEEMKESRVAGSS